LIKLPLESANAKNGMIGYGYTIDGGVAPSFINFKNILKDFIKIYIKEFNPHKSLSS